MTPRIWIDVEDLFEYARVNPRPSGIQRLAFEIYCNLQERYGQTGKVHFVRNVRGSSAFRVVDWQQIESLFDELTAVAVKPVAPAPTPVPKAGITPLSPTRKFVRKLAYRLSPAMRDAILEVRTTQARAFGAWVKLAAITRYEMTLAGAGMFNRLRGKGSPALEQASCGRASDNPGAFDEADPTAVAVPVVDEFALLSAPGDTLLVLGSPWSHPDYAGLIRGQRERGLRVALLVYDLIPIFRPEWCDRGLVRLFRSWYDSVFPLCDVLFAISRATAKDVELYARLNGIKLPGRVIPIPIGTGFSKGADILAPARRQNLPQPGTYALIVSTIEARKNHVLLFRIWRRLLEELPPERVPTLVFAGRVGWLVDDLLKQIANTNYLDGKLVLVENPPDDELATLYRGCLFTMFPSLYEGWGLPVTESLAFGKPCFISNRTSLPEAGGSLARAFDPDNLNEAYDMIRAVIEDRVDLSRWEAKVKREFRPVSWSASADAILDGVGAEVHQLEPMAAD